MMSVCVCVCLSGSYRLRVKSVQPGEVWANRRCCRQIPLQLQTALLNDTFLFFLLHTLFKNHPSSICTTVAAEAGIVLMLQSGPFCRSDADKV